MLSTVGYGVLIVHMLFTVVDGVVSVQVVVSCHSWCCLCTSDILYYSWCCLCTSDILYYSWCCLSTSVSFMLFVMLSLYKW